MGKCPLCGLDFIDEIRTKIREGLTRVSVFHQHDGGVSSCEFVETLDGIKKKMVERLPPVDPEEN